MVKRSNFVLGVFNYCVIASKNNVPIEFILYCKTLAAIYLVIVM